MENPNPQSGELSETPVEQPQVEFVKLPKDAFNARIEQAKKSAIAEYQKNYEAQQQQKEVEEATQKNQYKTLFENSQKTLNEKDTLIKSWEEKYNSREIDLAVANAVAKHKLADYIKPEDVILMAKSATTFGLFEGKPTIFMDSNVPRYTQAGPITIDEYISEFIESRPFLKAATVKPGSGSQPVGKIQNGIPTQTMKNVNENRFGKKTK